jgi:predicted transcriptional regulator
LYKANLAWGDLEDSLGRLEDAGALRKVVGTAGVFYEITDSGKRFLTNFVAVTESLPLGPPTKDAPQRKFGS